MQEKPREIAGAKFNTTYAVSHLAWGIAATLELFLQVEFSTGMATKIFPCKNCGKPVSPKAPTSQHCGYSYLVERHRRIAGSLRGCWPPCVLVIVGIGIYRVAALLSRFPCYKMAVN